MKNLIEGTKYARACSITGEGMNEGWVWCDGAFYTKHHEDTLKECVKDREGILDIFKETLEYHNSPHGEEEVAAYNTIVDKVQNNIELTPDELLEVAFGVDYVYYTEWECDEDFHYIVKGGKLEFITE